MTRRRGNSPSGRLRIVAGKWRSRLLPIADVPGLRPTSERIRETLFNWLAPYIDGARCLDLYAGTGALGFEALSRGADWVAFVERSPVAVAAMQAACRELGASAVDIEKKDAFVYLEGPPGKPYDIVFLDPPYADESLADLCRLLAKEGWLTAAARIYFEQDRRQPVPDLPKGWSIIREKTAGQVRYALIETGTSA